MLGKFLGIKHNIGFESNQCLSKFSMYRNLLEKAAAEKVIAGFNVCIVV